MNIIRRSKFVRCIRFSKCASNLNVQNNLRDGLPYLTLKNDANDYINAMLFTDKTLLFSIQYDGIVVCSISAFRQGNIHNKPAELGYYLAGGNCIAT